MYKKKEIIIIILIILVTITLAFLPSMINNTKVEVKEEETKTQNRINIVIDGEIKENEIKLNVPYGASYGYIISKIEIYLNDYSKLDDSLTKRYYEDSKITIESKDNNRFNFNSSNEEVITDSSKISISTASKDELMSLYGIGEKRAESIIEYREKNKIDSWESLRGLIGVSNEILQAIKEKAVL